MVAVASVEEVIPMRVRDLMSNPPVTAPPDMSLRDLASFLAAHEISGVPVVDDGTVVGVVSESDVVEKERGPDVDSCGLLARVLHRRRCAAAYASTVGEAMKSPPITIEGWMSVYEAAWLMSFYDINRLPVMDRDELVGIVSRSDLVRYFARSDLDIERDVREKIELLQAPRVSVASTQGRVLLEGELRSPTDLACLPHLVSCVPGVVAVDCRVTLSASNRRSELQATA
jgi:CBS domain-containing protein